MLRVAQNPGDYQRAHALVRKEGVNLGSHRLTFPTILAILHDEVVGLIGTTIRDNMIVAGPLVLNSDGRRTFTAIRLMEAYENAMRNIGISTFIIPAESGSITQKIVERYYKDASPYASSDGVMFYIRRLDGSQEVEHGP